MTDPAIPPNLPDDIESTHLRTVPGQTPAASATVSSVYPALHPEYNPLSTAHCKPGILVHVHPVLPRMLKRRNSSFLGQDRVDNLMKAHS